MNFLWTKKYQPKNFSKLDFHIETNEKLENLANENMPHLIIYGKRGSGKKTRTLCIL